MSEDTHEAIDVSQAYSSAVDSVNLINRLYDKNLTVSEKDLDSIQRNKDHLKIMLGKDFWIEQDLTPFQEAIDRTE